MKKKERKPLPNYLKAFLALTLISCLVMIGGGVILWVVEDSLGAIILILGMVTFVVSAIVLLPPFMY